MRQRKPDVWSIVLSMGASIALVYLGTGTVIFTLPLLLLTKRIQSTGKNLLIQGVTYAIAMFLQFQPYFGYFSPVNLGIILFGALFPLASALASLIYTGMGEKSSSILRKLVWASFPAFVLGTAFAVWITSSGATESLSGLNSSIAAVLQEFKGLDFTLSSDIILAAIIMLAVPVSIAFGAFPILISEFVLNSRDEQFQFEFANMKMPSVYAWLMLATVAAIVPGYMVDGYPPALLLAGWNCALGLGLHYCLNGFSILVSFFRRRTAYVSAGRVFVLTVLAGLLPGVNIAVFFGLFALGVLENWIKFR